MKKIKIKKLDIKADERGWFTEIVRIEDLGNKKKPFGQMYVTVANPGQTKGKHYHNRKTEWFCVIAGKGFLQLVDIKSGEKQEIEMGEGNMVAVQIAPKVWHAIENKGKKEMFLLAYIDESYNPDDPDTYYDYDVLRGLKSAVSLVRENDISNSIPPRIGNSRFP